MASFRKHAYIFICLTILLTSCSHRTYVGFYHYNKNSFYEGADVIAEEYLQLNKDSTFIFEQLNQFDMSDDISLVYSNFPGVGKYTIYKDTLKLNFGRRFSLAEFDSLKIDPRFFSFNDRIDRRRSKAILGTTIILDITRHRDSVMIGNMIKLKK